MSEEVRRIMKIKSTVRPALVRGELYNRIVAGTIEEVNGKPWNLPYVAVDKRITLDQIEWTRPALPLQSTKPKVEKVAGSKGAVYTVTTFGNGKKTCTCPGYSFRRFCKHTKT